MQERPGLSLLCLERVILAPIVANGSSGAVVSHELLSISGSVCWWSGGSPRPLEEKRLSIDILNDTVCRQWALG